MHGFITTNLPIDNESRIIAYGGTSIAWGGVLRPLDTIDFEKRDWIPNSGWPFSKERLIPFYNKSALFLDAPKINDFAIHKRTIQNFRLSPAFEPNIFYIMKKKYWDFGKRFKESFRASTDTTVIMNSHVTGLETEENGRIVSGASVKTLQGNKFQIFARHVVLAAGGIENARLLLLSRNKKHPKGLGNANDQAGRYYMDHPKMNGGILFFSKKTDISNHCDFNTQLGKCRLGIKLTEETQRKHQLLNSYIQADPMYRRASRFLRNRLQVKRVELMNHMEQAPLPSNRITLSEQKDAFGLSKPSIHWSLSSLDKDTVKHIHKLISETGNMTGEFSFESPLLDKTYDWNVDDSSHHMGTTRMGTDPKKSVTNTDARVHGIKNLFIAGSSLFPTVGYANPTYTIFALTQKLSEHLKKQYPNSRARINRWSVPKKKNVLLVGSGNRVKSTVLPALYCLRNEFDLMGVLSRTKKDLSQWYKNIPLSTDTDFNKFDVSNADIIFISVSTKNVGSVLRKLNNWDVSKATLVLETPVIHPKDIKAIKLLRKYKKVVVAEDFLYLRMYVEAKRLIDSGVIGNLKYIHLLHCGVLHHTMALVKFLSDSNTIIFTQMIARGVSEELRIRCGNGVTASLIGPRDYDIGKYLIVGDQGTIADYPISKENHVFISVQRTPQNGYAGISIDGKLLDPTGEEELFQKNLPNYRLVGVKINEPLWMNQMKIHSLMKILRSVCESEGFRYGPITAFSNWLPWRFLNKYGFFVDLPIGSRTSVVNLLIKIRSLI